MRATEHPKTQSIYPIQWCSYFNKTKTRVKERKYWRNVFTCVNSSELKERRKKKCTTGFYKKYDVKADKRAKRITKPHWNPSKEEQREKNR